jgi:hypothetical protein
MRRSTLRTKSESVAVLDDCPSTLLPSYPTRALCERHNSDIHTPRPGNTGSCATSDPETRTALEFSLR